MFAQSSFIWAFALIALSNILVAVSALQDAPRVVLTSHRAPRHWYNGTSGRNTTSDDKPSPLFVTTIASPSSTSHVVHVTIATSLAPLSSFTALFSLPRLSSSGLLLNSTILKTTGSKPASPAFSSIIAAETSIASSPPSFGYSSMDQSTVKSPGEDKPASPSSSFRPVTEASVVSSTSSPINTTTITFNVSGYKPTSSPSWSSLPGANNGTTRSGLSLDGSTATVIVRGHTVLLLPAPTKSSPTTKRYASPTPWIHAQNTTMYPSHEKIKKIAGISIGSSVAGGSLIFTIKKGVWMALEKAQEVHPDWSKTKVIDYLIRGSHSTDSSWSSESTDSEDFEDSSDSSDSWDDFPALAEREGQTLAQVEGFLLTEESLNPGSVFEPGPVEQVRSVVGEDALGEPFAPLPPPLPIDQPLPPDPERGENTGKDKGKQTATGSDPGSDYKSSWYSKTLDSKTRQREFPTADPRGHQGGDTATMTTYINGKTVLVLPPGATGAPFSLPPVDLHTPWAVVAQSDATASNESHITGFIPPHDQSTTIAAATISSVLGVAFTYSVTDSVWKSLKEYSAKESNAAELIERMVRVKERLPLTLDVEGEPLVDQIENFLMMREAYNPGGTFTGDEMSRITSIIGRQNLRLWTQPSVPRLPKWVKEQYYSSNLFSEGGLPKPPPRPWPTQWGKPPPGLSGPTSESISNPQDEYTMSGGLGDPPEEGGPPAGGSSGDPPNGGSIGWRPRVPWDWKGPIPRGFDPPDPRGLRPPTDPDDVSDSDDSSDEDDDDQPKNSGPKTPDRGADDNGSSADGSNDDTRTYKPKSQKSIRSTSEARKSVHWQTPLTSNFPTTALGSVPKSAKHEASASIEESVKPTGQPTTTRLQTSVEPNVTTTERPTIFKSLTPSGPSVNTARQSTVSHSSTPIGPSVKGTKHSTFPQTSTVNSSNVDATRQPTTSSQLTSTEACTAAACISSRWPTPTNHAPVWSHSVCSMQPKCSSYDEYGTCLFTGLPTATSHKTMWSYPSEVTNTWPTLTPTPTPTPKPTSTPLPPRPIVTTHTMVTVTVGPPTPPRPPPSTPLPSTRRPIRLCNGNIWTDCCVYRYGHSHGLMDCFEGALPHKHHMDPPCHGKRQTNCCVYNRKGAAIRCLPTNIIR